MHLSSADLLADVRSTARLHAPMPQTGPALMTETCSLRGQEAEGPHSMRPHSRHADACVRTLCIVDRPHVRF